MKRKVYDARRLDKEEEGEQKDIRLKNDKRKERYNTEKEKQQNPRRESQTYQRYGKGRMGKYEK